jgi:hypothetical protein
MRLPVTLHCRPSGSLIAALVVAHAAAALGLAATEISLATKTATLLGLALSLLFSLRRQSRPRFAALTLRADGQIEAWLSDGEPSALLVDGRTTVLPGLVVLMLRGEQGRVALALPPDALATGEHRLLRLWLRWKAVPA